MQRNTKKAWRKIWEWEKVELQKKKEEELNEKPDRESGIEGKVVVY